VNTQHSTSDISRSQHFVVNPSAHNLSKVDRLIYNNGPQDTISAAKGVTQHRPNTKPLVNKNLNKDKQYVLSTPEETNGRYIKTEDDNPLNRYLPTNSDFVSSKRKQADAYDTGGILSNTKTMRKAAAMGNTPGNFSNMHSHGTTSSGLSYNKPGGKMVDRGVR
jgi:hypothetical protein